MKYEDMVKKLEDLEFYNDCFDRVPDVYKDEPNIQVINMFTDAYSNHWKKMYGKYNKDLLNFMEKNHHYSILLMPAASDVLCVVNVDVDIDFLGLTNCKKYIEELAKDLYNKILYFKITYPAIDFKDILKVDILKES